MMDFFTHLQPWHWLTLGIALLILELMGAGGFLLGICAAALALALLTFALAIEWHWQLVLFAILSLAFTVIYWKRFRRFNERSEQPLLNDRTRRMIGRKVPLLTPLRNGTGKVQIEDALWTVAGAQDLPQGTIVTITGAEGMTLLVEESATANAAE